MPQLVPHNSCTACGACMAACPQEAISMQTDKQGALYPKIDFSRCIECNLCEKICPIHNPCSYYYPQKCYAAWNVIDEERKTSASGGIAIAMYEYALKHKYICIGAVQEVDFSVVHKIARKANELRGFKNSKYVFSNAYNIFSEVKHLLKQKQDIIIIGLLCQIAAFRKLFPKSENLLLIDIVCHGSVPTIYLQQHIHALETEYRQKAFRMSFRAPEKGTATYHFTLYNEKGEIFYSKRSFDGDKYNIAFHRSIAYRENCYNCNFARPERVSDITIGDYHGLGIKQRCTYTQDEVSVILTHTPKGLLFVEQLEAEGYIYAEQRLIEEPIMGDAQLRRPSPKTIQRYDFETFLEKTNGDFEIAMNKVLRKQKKREKIEYIKNILRKFKPNR